MRMPSGSFSRDVVASIVLSFLSAPVWAIPVQFTYSGTIDVSTIAGVSSGDTVTVTVFADNGGTSILDQDWNEADLLSATLTAGSYSATYGAPLTSNLDPAFSTDSLGTLDKVTFLGGVIGQNSDTFGTGGPVLLFDDFFLDYYGNPAIMTSPLSSTQSLDSWSGPSISTVSVPEPPMLALLVIGALALRMARNGRRAQLVSA